MATGILDMNSRRSKAVRGFVDFPINDPSYENSNEGGMFVRLVVDDSSEDPWIVCCGGYCGFDYDEEYMGDDLGNQQDHHFPNLADTLPRTHSPSEGWDKPWEKVDFGSVAYLAVINLGSTGWSGMKKDTGEPFLCRYENLTAEGKELYDLIKKLYEGKGTLYLQTWLDT